MILGCFDTKTQARIHCLPIDDTLYNDHQWLKNVQSAVYHQAKHTDTIGVIGHTKDDSSYYLSLFPNWIAVELPNFESLSATPLRTAYLKHGIIDEHMPKPCQKFLSSFMQTDDYTRLQQEYRQIDAFKDSYKDTPYPPIFCTADALVVQAGHVLLIERGGEYGRKLWALPEGFLDKDETWLDGAIRELSEETHLTVKPCNLKSQTIFDAPDRSPRGRIITCVFYFELTGDKLPDVIAGDDASHAFWLPLYALDAKQMFEDHYSIITKILGL